MKPFPISVDAATRERFTLRDRADVATCLQALAARRATATIYFGADSEMLHTELVGVNAAYGELMFAPGHDAQIEHRLMAAGEFMAESMLDSVRVQFQTGHAETVPGRTGVSFRARIPDSLVRMQRRDAMRACTPADARPVCKSQVHGLALVANVMDISTGGVALELPQTGPRLSAGDLLADCRIEVPSLGTLACALKVAYVQAGMQGIRDRAGCAFVELPATTRRQVADYVARLERARLGV